MAELSDADLKFVLSADVDDELLQKAIRQLNAEIEGAKVSQLKLELREAMMPPKEPLPQSYWETRFGGAGKALEDEFTKAAEVMNQLWLGMEGEILQRRIQDERLIAEQRRKLRAAEEEERIKQAGGFMAYTRERMGATPDTTRERVERERAEATVRREMQRAEHAERVRQAGGRGVYAWEQLKEGLGKQGGGNVALGAIMGGQGGGGMLGQAGGAIGMALGGPAGAMVGEALAKAIPGAIAAPAKAATAAMSEVTKGLQEVQGSLGPLGAGLEVASDLFASISDSMKGIPIVGEIVGPLMDTVGKIPGIFKSLLEAALPMVQKLSPGIMKQFSVALEDAQATIGQAFLPVIQEMIPYIKELGTIIAQALPSDQDMRKMFGAVFDSIRDLVQELAPLIAPVISMLTTGVRIFVDVLTGLVKAFKWVANAISDVIKFITFGMVDLKQMFGGSVSGAGSARQAATAARPAHLGGIEEYQRQLQLETFQGGRDTSAAAMPRNVNNINNTVENMAITLKAINTLFMGLMNPGWLVSQIAAGVVRLLPSGMDIAGTAERAAIDSKVAAGKAGGGLKHWNPKKDNTSFWGDVFR